MEFEIERSPASRDLTFKGRISEHELADLRLDRMKSAIELLIQDCNDAVGQKNKAEAELAESRETIKRLNRRVQVAEAGVAEKVKASAGRSLGRALANAAADAFMHERDEALAELAALKARIANSHIVEIANYGDPFIVLPDHFTVPDSLKGKRVRLVVDSDD